MSILPVTDFGTTPLPSVLKNRRELELNSPSRKDNISAEEEKRLRRRYIAIIQRCGMLLELPNITTCTAAVFWHRYFNTVSLAKADPLLVVQGALFLAGKVEEQSRRVRDVINVAYRVQHEGDEALQISDHYWSMKDQVVRCEQELLRVLGFDMDVIHPHHYLLHIVRELEGTEELSSVAFYILNDSLLTNLCLQYPPAVLACAAIYLAGELTSDSIHSSSYSHSRDMMGGEWWERFTANRLAIEDICHQLCDLYDLGDRDFSKEYKKPGSRRSDDQQHISPKFQPAPPHQALTAPTTPTQPSHPYQAMIAASSSSSSAVTSSASSSASASSSSSSNAWQLTVETPTPSSSLPPPSSSSSIMAPPPPISPAVPRSRSQQQLQQQQQTQQQLQYSQQPPPQYSYSHSKIPSSSYNKQTLFASLSSSTSASSVSSASSSSSSQSLLQSFNNAYDDSASSQSSLNTFSSTQMNLDSLESYTPISPPTFPGLPNLSSPPYALMPSPPDPQNPSLPSSSLPSISPPPSSDSSAPTASDLPNLDLSSSLPFNISPPVPSGTIPSTTNANPSANADINAMPPPPRKKPRTVRINRAWNTEE